MQYYCVGIADYKNKYSLRWQDKNDSLRTQHLFVFICLDICRLPVYLTASIFPCTFSNTCLSCHVSPAAEVVEMRVEGRWLVYGVIYSVGGRELARVGCVSVCRVYVTVSVLVRANTRLHSTTLCLPLINIYYWITYNCQPPSSRYPSEMVRPAFF